MYTQYNSFLHLSWLSPSIKYSLTWTKPFQEENDDNLRPCIPLMVTNSVKFSTYILYTVYNLFENDDDPMHSTITTDELKK